EADAAGTIVARRPGTVVGDDPARPGRQRHLRAEAEALIGGLAQPHVIVAGGVVVDEVDDVDLVIRSHRDARTLHALVRRTGEGQRHRRGEALRGRAHEVDLVATGGQEARVGQVDVAVHLVDRDPLLVEEVRGGRRYRLDRRIPGEDGARERAVVHRN